MYTDRHSRENESDGKKIVLMLVGVVALWVSYYTFLVMRGGTTVSYDICDIDFDGDCDTKDRAIFEAVMGQCINGDKYNEPADSDKDGCITEADRKRLFPETER